MGEGPNARWRRVWVVFLTPRDRAELGGPARANGLDELGRWPSLDIRWPEGKDVTARADRATQDPIFFSGTIRSNLLSRSPAIVASLDEDEALGAWLGLVIRSPRCFGGKMWFGFVLQVPAP